MYNIFEEAEDLIRGFIASDNESFFPEVYNAVLFLFELSDGSDRFGL